MDCVELAFVHQLLPQLGKSDLATLHSAQLLGPEVERHCKERSEVFAAINCYAPCSLTGVYLVIPVTFDRGACIEEHLSTFIDTPVYDFTRLKNAVFRGAINFLKLEIHSSSVPEDATILSSNPLFLNVLRILSRIRDIRLILVIGPKIDFSAFFAFLMNSGIAANLRKLRILEPAFENPLQHLQPLITFVLESNKVISELDYHMRTLTTEHISMLRRFLELPHFKRLNLSGDGFVESLLNEWISSSAPLSGKTVGVTLWERFEERGIRQHFRKLPDGSLIPTPLRYPFGEPTHYFVKEHPTVEGRRLFLVLERIAVMVDGSLRHTWNGAMYFIFA
ncbi:hypothetical protein QR680_012361 [Steinernema hermaphroditum]|uniref:Uncharacterized protein n=1 Tax=Steinernema hermaphroditum TaxID=289476 RepID=A0AA39I1T1_9BILA|nr:hypothetical protein QR680_012361 [Steinernema hermaphroditum]